MVAQFTAAYVKSGKWYLGFIEEFPGVNTQGRTLAEAKRNLKEALELVIQANVELARKSCRNKAVEEPISVVVE